MNNDNFEMQARSTTLLITANVHINTKHKDDIMRINSQTKKNVLHGAHNPD